MITEITEIEYLIEQLEEKYSIKFKRLGKNYFALCPFHLERTPSFSVYEKNDEVYYYCFGCQAKGIVKKLLGQKPDEKEKLKFQVVKTINTMYHKYISFLLTASTIFEEVISELKEDEFNDYLELLSERARINTLINFFLDEEIDYETKIQHFLKQKVPAQGPVVDILVLSKHRPLSTADLVISNIKKNKELLLQNAAIKAIEEVFYVYL